MLNIKWIFVYGATTFLITGSPAVSMCPDRNEVQQFDLDQFLGDWFIVAATAPVEKNVSKCSQFEVKQVEDEIFSFNFTAISYKTNGPVTFLATIRKDDDLTGYWQLQGSLKMLGPYKHRIISVDYTSYIVFIVCRENDRVIPNRDFGMIWSRQKTLNSTILKQLKKSVAHYISDADILDVDQTTC